MRVQEGIKLYIIRSGIQAGTKLSEVSAAGDKVSKNG